MDNQNPIFLEMQEYVVIGNSEASSEVRHPLYAVQHSVEPQPGTYSCNNVKVNISKSSIPAPEYKWSINDTKILIDFYSKYRKKIGTFEIKNQKMLWEKIAEELQKLGIKVTPNNCLNRWRVVERNYKKFVDNQNKTGRSRKYFEYEAEMTEIFGKKKNIHPQILLDSEKVDSFIETIPEKEPSIETPTQEQVTPTVKFTPGSCLTPRRVRPIKNTTMEKFRQDKKAYFDAKLEIEREKLQELKHRNELIAERNEILKNFKCQCQFNSIL